jgi:hypothetical protein
MVKMNLPVPLTRPVDENIICWHDDTHFFSVNDIGLQIRVWIDRGDPGSSSDMPVGYHRAIVNQCILNDLPPQLSLSWLYEEELGTLAKNIAGLLKERHKLQINAIEVTVRGQGSLHYPEWP